MKLIYCRCNGGDYFLPNLHDGHCPLDGWASPETQELGRAIEVLLKGANELSIAELRRIGVSEAAIARAIVIEFGSDLSWFGLIAPRGYMVDEERVPIEAVDHRRFR